MQLQSIRAEALIRDAGHSVAPKPDARPAPATLALCAGARVLTLDGEVAVEDLTPGARIITRDTGMARLVALSFAREEAEVILVKAGSLGQNRPERDSMVLPQTALHLRDWRAKAFRGAERANVRAEELIDDQFVIRCAARSRRVVTLVFDRPHVIYADGLELATSA
jgi:hypothetical protein